MESAGKRITRPPDLLLNQFLVPTSTPAMIPTTTIFQINASTSTITMQSITTINVEPSVQQMFNQMMNAFKKSTEKSEENIATITAAVKDIRKEIIDLREQTTKQNKQCIQRWQETDIHLTKLEYDHSHKNYITQKDIINGHVTQKIEYLEGEAVCIRKDLTRLVS